MCRNGDDSKAYLIEYSERYLSQGDAVVNGYREGQDVCCASLSRYLFHSAACGKSES